jgi:enoyl-CoA hydratase/carnithine racemase
MDPKEDEIVTKQEPVVVTAQQDDVLVITINRPEARNAVNGEVARGIATAIELLEMNDGLRAGILTGAGGTFCSGMDLKAVLLGDLPWIEGKGFGGLTQAPPRKPLIAAVEGWAVAGGFELLLACDLVVAADTAMFGVPEVKRATVAGGGAAMLLGSRIPQAIALELLLTGDPITAARAAEVGLVNRTVPEGKALEGAMQFATTIAANGPLAIQATKQVVRAAADWSFEQGWVAQASLVQPVYDSIDAQEGARAFTEKREPVWIGH